MEKPFFAKMIQIIDKIEFEEIRPFFKKSYPDKNIQKNSKSQKNKK